MKIAGFEAFDLLDDLSICGCGRPELAYKKVHNMLRRAADPAPWVMVIPTYMHEDSKEAGFAYYMAYVLDQRGYLDHGSSIDSANITEKGKALLELLDMLEDHNYAYAETADGQPVFL